MKSYPFLLLALLIAGCAPSHAPESHAGNATPAKAEQGTIVGVRAVGPALSQVAALRGTLVAGIATAAVDHAPDGTLAIEYIVRKPGGELISVTQRDKASLMLGQKVLVITGNQARVVLDSAANLADTVSHRPVASAYASGSSATAQW